MASPEVFVPKILTAQQVADATGLSVWSVYDHAREGRLPHRKIGRRVVFNAAALAAYLAGSDRASTNDSAASAKKGTRKAGMRS